ncbi:MAG: glycosyltransferase family 9 protein [Armatimonadetes bacterium]|nr:glycosyltransferase family 9 protein [Armatimonadota bacterium]
MTRIQNVGDCIVILPTLSQLRRSFPEAEIHVLAGTSAGEAIFRMGPAVDRILRTRWPAPTGWREKWREIEMIGDAHYDAVLLSTEETGMALKVFLAGVPVRIGFDRIVHISGTHVEARPHLLTRVLHQLPGEHEVTVNLKLAEALGAKLGEPRFDLQIPAEAHQSLSKVLEDAGLEAERALVVHVGTKQERKRWSAECFASVCDALSAQGLSIVLVGVAEERPLVEQMKARMQAPCIDLCGRTSLAELAALFVRCRAFLGNDSGPMHLAAACGAKVCAVFVQSDPAGWGPWTAPERRRVFTDAEATPEALVAALREMLAMDNSVSTSLEAG